MRAGIVLALGLAACGAPSREAPPPAGPARYAGRLPGPDRAARLHLGDDGRYLLTTQPLGAPGSPYRAEGFYAWAGDTLRLDPQDAEGRAFLRDGDTLRPLEPGAEARHGLRPLPRTALPGGRP